MTSIKTKNKRHKKCIIKKLSFEDHKHYLQVTQLENKIDQLVQK